MSAVGKRRFSEKGLNAAHSHRAVNQLIGHLPLLVTERGVQRLEGRPRRRRSGALKDVPPWPIIPPCIMVFRISLIRLALARSTSAKVFHWVVWASVIFSSVLRKAIRPSM